MLACCLGGINTKVQWDTGSQVSLVPQAWLKKYQPHVKVKALQDLLDEGEVLDLRGANGMEIPYQGWVEFHFTLNKGESGVKIPMLVCKDTISEPLIGFNVISHFIQIGSFDGGNDIVKDITKALGGNITNTKVKSLVKLVGTTACDSELLGTVKTGKRVTRIPKKSSVNVTCMVHAGWVKEGMAVLFLPDQLEQWPHQF